MADDRRESECDTPEYTEGPCHCAKHDSRTARREGYAAAINEPGSVDQDSPEDAAMAVADAEQHSANMTIVRLRMQLDQEELENARLRAEVELWKSRYRSSVETYRDVADAHRDAVQESMDRRN